MTDGTLSAKSERRRGSGVQYVYNILRDDIINLTLPPGSPIDEIQLAQRLEMSRTPIREALVRLASEGLVTTLPNRSTVVSTIDFLNLHTFFDALTLMYRVTTRLAAQYHDVGDLAALHDAQARFTRTVAAQDALGMIACNRDFHAAIAIAGRNPYFEGLCLRLLDEGRRLLRFYYSSFNDQLPPRYIDQHEEIIAAIAARDVARADEVARNHADEIIAQIRAMISQDRRHHIEI